MIKVTLVNPWDRDGTTRLIVNGTDLGYATYDEHGSAGTELLVQVGRGLERVLQKAGVSYQFEEIEEDEDTDD